MIHKKNEASFQYRGNLRIQANTGWTQTKPRRRYFLVSSFNGKDRKIYATSLQSMVIHDKEVWSLVTLIFQKTLFKYPRWAVMDH